MRNNQYLFQQDHNILMENRSRMTDLHMRRIVSRYELGDMLGRGAYSQVFKARHLDNGNTFAVKVISNKVLADNDKVKECINNELAIHNIIEPGPHIVKFYELLQTKNNCYFVYQFCEGGTLLDLLRKEGPFDEKRALEIFCQLVAGLKVLRKYNIMHRDLKPENVLIQEEKFKLADFGFCKQLGQENMTKTMLGSPLYMAPEILRGQAYTVSADIWSVGVIFYEMLYGFCPYQSSSIATLISAIQEKPLHFDSSSNISSSLKRFISKCLQKDSKQRISWQEFFQEISELKVGSSENLPKEESSPRPLIRNLNKIKDLHTTVHSLDQGIKRSESPVKTPSEMKSKYELFKENYHKHTPSEYRNDHQIFVSIDNTQSKGQRSRSTTRTQPKEKQKEGKIAFNQLITQHEGCLQVLRVCMDIMESRYRKNIILVGVVLKGIRKILERIYTRINLEDVEMLPILSMVKYEMIQVEKMQGQIQKWAGHTLQEPQTSELPVSLAEPLALLSTYN